MRHPVAPPQSVDTMNSIAPQDIWRSEAFAEDLIDDAASTYESRPASRWLSSTVLCVLPLGVALVGGVMAFLHSIG